MFNIKELRLKKGISQTELANQIGVTIRTIQHWEKGTKNITIDKLQRLNNYFNLNLYSNELNDSKLLLVAEQNEEYKSEKDIKIELLEEKLKLKDEQLENFKMQLELFKKNKK